MVSALYLLAGAAITVLAAPEHSKRQKDDLQNIWVQKCSPNIYNFVPPPGTEDAYDAREKLRKESTFPCEHTFWVEQNCRETEGNVAPESVQADYKCVCASKKFELDAACISCYEANGAPKSVIDSEKAFYSTIEKLACSATTPHPLAFWTMTASVWKAMQTDISDSATKTTGASDDSTTTASETPLSSLINIQEAQLDYIMEVCFPNLYKFTMKYKNTEYTQEDYAAMEKLAAESIFPCEQFNYLERNCTEVAGRGPKATTPEEIAAEHACICNNKMHEKRAACMNCHRVHGYDPEYIMNELAVISAIESKVCLATGAATTDYYGVAASVRDKFESSYTGGMMLNQQTGSDLFPSKTEISNYYTASGAATTTGAPAQATGTGAAAAASSSTAATGGAGELKAAGGIVMALFGVMVAV